MEIWSLARFPEGHEPARPTPPEVWECDDPRWPPIPAQDFSNLPRQQKGLHAKGFEYMRLSERTRGTHLELRTDRRRLPRRVFPTSGCSRRSRRSTCIPSSSRCSTSASDEPHETTFADVAEGVRAAIAAYTLALDDGRTDDVVATFCADGVVDIPGLGTHVGHDALRAAFARVEPRQPQRHLVLNTLVTDWNDHEASAISDVVFILKGDVRLGDPARRPIRRHPPPRRRHVAVPPSRGHVRAITRASR